MLDGDIHRNIDAFRTGIRLGDYPNDEAVALMSRADFYRFVALREPFDRAVSAYLDKFVLARNRSSSWQHTRAVVGDVQGTADPDFDAGISFAEFVEYLWRRRGARVDPHWSPQSEFMRGLEFDRIYNLDELSLLVSDLEARCGERLPLESRNRTRRRRDRVVPGCAFLRPGLLERPETLSSKSFLEPELAYKLTVTYRDDYANYYRSSASSDYSGLSRMPGPGSSRLSRMVRRIVGD